MKTFKITALLFFALILGISCREELPDGWKLAFYDIEFNQSEKTVPINSATKEFAVEFHRNGKQAPAGYDWRDRFRLEIDKTSTAKLNKQFEITDVSSMYEDGTSFDVKYNKTSSTGDFIITVMPDAITKPVDIIIKNLFYNEDGSQAKMVVHLVPQAQ